MWKTKIQNYGYYTNMNKKRLAVTNEHYRDLHKDSRYT